MIVVYSFRGMDVSGAELCPGVISDLEKEIVQETEKAKASGEVVDLSLAFLVDGAVVACDPGSPFVEYFKEKEGYVRRDGGEDLVFFVTHKKLSDVLWVAMAFLYKEGV